MDQRPDRGHMRIGNRLSFMAPTALTSTVSNQLASQEANTVFTANGELTNDAIATAKEILSSKALEKNLNIPAGFSKYTTTSFARPGGETFQLHFYMNSKTSEVFYGQDYKAAISRCHALRREQARGRDVRRIGG